MVSERTTEKAATVLLLVVILGVALGLRVWGIRFGLPYAYHVDEPTYVSAALNLGAGIIGKQPNPTGFSNILFGEFALYFVLGKLLGVFNSAADFERTYRTDPSMFLLLSRLTSALLGAANVLALYWLGRAARNRFTGLLAASLLAVAFLHVRDSHYGVPDIAATLFVSLAVLGSVLALQKAQWRYIGLGAAVAGLAITSKWSTGWIVIPVILATFWLVADPEIANKQNANVWTKIGVATSCLVAGLLIGGFQLFLKPATYLEYALREARAGAAGGFGYWQIDTVPGWIFYLKTLAYGLGPAMLVLAMMGLGWRIFRVIRGRDRISLLIIAFPLFYFIAMGATRHYFARYTLPLVPFMALFAAEAVMILADRMKARQGAKWAWGITALVTSVAIVQPLAASIRHNVLLTRTDTRTLAKVWIEQNIPQGARIAVDWPVHGPPLSTPEKAASYSDKVYDVTIVGGTGLADHSIEWYREQGFDYLIASSFIYQIPLVFPEQDRVRRAFYESLGRELTEVQVFSSTADRSEPDFVFDEIYGPAVSLWQRERPGPTIKIYKINQ
jgi:hypothetical protein